MKEYKVVYQAHFGRESINVRCKSKVEAKEMFSKIYPEHKDSIIRISIER